MAVNRAVSSHAGWVGLTLGLRYGHGDPALGRMTSRAELDEAEHHSGKSELYPCSVVVILEKCPERSISNAPLLAATAG